MNEIRKFLISFENLLGVYRNFMFFKKVTKSLMCVRMLLELTVILYLSFFIGADRTHFVSVLLYSFLTILLGFYTSEKFKAMIMNLNTSNEYLPKSPQMKKTMKRRIIYLACLLFWYSFVEIVVGVYYHNFFKPETKTASVFRYVFSGFSQVMLYASDYRFILEFAIVWSIYISISDQLSCIVRVLGIEIINRNIQRKTNSVSSISLYKNTKAFEKLPIAYEIVERIATLANSIFYWQTATMIGIVVSSYIALIYTDIVLNVSGSVPLITQFMYKAVLWHYLLALFCLSYAGQQIHNNCMKIKQLLTRLLVDSFLNEEYKSVKGFLRQVNTHPIQMKTFALVVDMSLLPTSVALVTSHLVAFLQFNNVV